MGPHLAQAFVSAAEIILPSRIIITLL